MYSAKVWREIPQRYRLEAAKCKKCGQGFFPPRLICNQCKSREFEPINLPWQGTLVAFTVIHIPPVGFADQTPYAAGIIDVGQGIRLTCQIADVAGADLQIGQKLRLEFRAIQRGGHQDVLC